MPCMHPLCSLDMHQSLSLNVVYDVSVDPLTVFGNLHILFLFSLSFCFMLYLGENAMYKLKIDKIMHTY